MEQTRNFRLTICFGALVALAACASSENPSGGGAGSPSVSSPSPRPSPVEGEGGHSSGEPLLELNLFGSPDAPKIQSMAQKADAVVVGTVRSIQTRWERAELGKPLIYTYVQVEVEDSIKGGASGVITIRTVGGRVGGKMLVVSHVPEFRHVGERALLFLKRDGSANRYKVPFDKPGKVLVHNNDQLTFLDRQISLATVRDVIAGRTTR